MRRRKSRSTGARARKYSGPARQGPRAVPGTRRSTPRRETRTSPLVSSRRSHRRLSGTPEPSAGLALTRRRRDGLPDRLRNRRAALYAQRRTREGLPLGVLSTRRPDENASSGKTRRSLCTRKKAARRHMIIATGYGGRNGVRTYKKERKTCH